jgi:hypothetical protein
MFSTREQALTGLFLCLQSITGPTVKRNEPLPTKVPEAGLIILRDGDPGEPEVILSPTRYVYQHRAEVEVLVQEADQTERDAALDTLLVAVGTALAGDSSLGGKVDIAHPGSPELLQETIEGAPTIKAALIPVFLEYTTLNPLQ